MDIEQRCQAAESKHKAFDIDLNKWSLQVKPHGLSGCFRLRNEEEFMRSAVLSHLQWLDEAVLVVQPSEDKTLEIAQELQKQFPDKIRIEHYPFTVFQIDTPGHFNSPENSVYTMMHLTNWALSRCRFSWIAKIEGDVTALPTFERIRFWIDMNQAVIAYIGRVGLNVAGPEGLQFSSTEPRNAGWDEGVFNNDPDWWHCVRHGKWESLNMGDHREKLRNCGWSFFHMKRCKAKYQTHAVRDRQKWQPRDRAHVEPALEEYAKAHPYPGSDEHCPDMILLDS